MVGNASHGVEEARSVLAAIRGRTLTTDERAERTIAVARHLFAAARHEETWGERGQREKLASLVGDERSKAMTVALADQLHRTHDDARMHEQLRFLSAELGAPAQLGRASQRLLDAAAASKLLPSRLVRVGLDFGIRLETRGLVHEATPESIRALVRARAKQGIRVNLNLLGEAVLGEREAESRVARLCELVAIPEVSAISVKISSIVSQRSSFALDATVNAIVPRLARIYGAATDRPTPARVTLDMEGYEDVEPTIEAFRRAIALPGLERLEPGVVLQAYLPDAHARLEELVAIADARVNAGGACCRVRIVKGANLATERHRAAISGHALPIYPSKEDVDASALLLVDAAVRTGRASVLRVGVGSHNVFDLAHALVLASERSIGPGLELEMLEGMANPLCRVVAQLAPLTVYAPVVGAGELASAVAYLVRRLDENTAPENHLARSFAIEAGGEAFEAEAARFSHALARASAVSTTPMRMRPRPSRTGFSNVPDDDFVMTDRRVAAHARLEGMRTASAPTIASLVDGHAVGDSFAPGFDPSRPGAVPYRLRTADAADIARALEIGSSSALGSMPLGERAAMLDAVAAAMSAARADLVAAIVMDVGKRVLEADTEVSEAIDFARYYADSLRELGRDPTLALGARGLGLVLGPWNFPLAIPAGGVFASLAAGNPVILKPAPEAPFVAHRFVTLARAAGVPKDALSLVLTTDENASRLVVANEVRYAVLTGATATARMLRAMHPTLPLFAETGGKNAMIVTSMADADLAIEDTVRSAFGFAGQKCSAASLLVCEAEVYDDPSFRERLVDAASSLVVGSAWDEASFVTPLIRPASGPLARALSELHDDESWLLAPRTDPSNPQLLHPSIRLGVARGSFCHRTELFGPVLSMMRARDLDDAIAIANDTGYGLTAGLHSLDVREQTRFCETIHAGNVYVCRGTTGAIVRRQPFGGLAASHFGPGVKTGGPNTVLSLAIPGDGASSGEEAPIDGSILRMIDEDRALDAREKEALRARARADQHAMTAHFGAMHDPESIPTQRNLFRYLRCEGAVLVVGAGASRHAVVREAIAFERVLGRAPIASFVDFVPPFGATVDDLRDLHTADALASRMRHRGVRRARVLGEVPAIFHEAAALADVFVDASPFVEASRVVLHHALEEQAVTIDVHRYGNPVKPAPAIEPLVR